MRYMLLICGETSVMEKLGADPESAARMERDTVDWVAEMDGGGIRTMGDQLSPADSATTVRTRHGDVLVSDGPFAETKEQILGFDIIECANLDEAIEVAAKHPVARHGSIEVRPFWTD